MGLFQKIEEKDMKEFAAKINKEKAILRSALFLALRKKDDTEFIWELIRPTNNEYVNINKLFGE
jgi:hypothetical protein